MYSVYVYQVFLFIHKIKWLKKKNNKERKNYIFTICISLLYNKK